jgi:hypothetical protein
MGSNTCLPILSKRGSPLWAIGCLAVVCFSLVLVAPALAGEHHSGGSLICNDCHVAHFSQSHAMTSGGTMVSLGTNGPYASLLRNDVNDLCLTCHDGQSFAPDVFGANGGVARNRTAGGLNSAPGHKANDTGYDDPNGHSLWSTAAAPGGTWANTTEGLECTDCHSQHGQNVAQYRNLQFSTGSTNKFYNKALTYAIGTNDLTKDVYEHSAKAYAQENVDFNEPSTSASAYAAWCQSCHTYFHAASGSAWMGGASGGDANHAFPWLRHPQADVNIGQNATYISSLSQFNSHTNRVKVMDSQGLWNGTTADNTVTPSCFSCHKSHGDKNPFGLIFMTGTGTVTEEGDGGQYRDLCRQCHTQGA